MSSKLLFSAVLEITFQNLNWSINGPNINTELLTIETKKKRKMKVSKQAYNILCFKKVNIYISYLNIIRATVLGPKVN